MSWKLTERSLNAPNEPSKVGLPHYSLLGYFRFYEGTNMIGDKGCKFLSRVSIPHINTINICKHVSKIEENQISSLGLSHLIKAEWR